MEQTKIINNDIDVSLILLAERINNLCDKLTSPLPHITISRNDNDVDTNLSIIERTINEIADNVAPPSNHITLIRNNDYGTLARIAIDKIEELEGKV